MRDLKAPELDEFVRRGLRSDERGLSVAGEFLRSSDDPRWCEEAFERWTCGNLVEKHPENDFSCYLLRHQYRTEDAIDFIAHEEPEEAALLAMEHAPRRVLEYVRQALASCGQLLSQVVVPPLTFSHLNLNPTLNLNPVCSQLRRLSNHSLLTRRLRL